MYDKNDWYKICVDYTIKYNTDRKILVTGFNIGYKVLKMNHVMKVQIIVEKIYWSVTNKK